MDTLRTCIEYVARFIEALAVLIMFVFIVVGTVQWIVLSGRKLGKTYPNYRMRLGKSLLVGLELLLAADIIRTVALELTPLTIATLAALVLIRTFLCWTLTVEVEGRWPWQKKELIISKDWAQIDNNKQQIGV